ncbi:tetratricopeptide repeat-containing sulfotransferase family protein [Phenylobacterium montanum]|uniref:Sulfotransferase n=1 Tax=Phenylobacterium montanum TaxID=2823693 RepID=A0A975G1I3_9CAUL|nr:tetratricopeptide repeat-containing sulfotransferase family protein [Caulobacter sp. S6]QUD89170.1 sulfotransferase [Caulobacter sp. S6]
MQITPATAASSPIEHEVRRLRALQQQGQYEEALQSALPLLAQIPENRDLLLIIGGSLRLLGRIAEALEALDRLVALQPRFSLGHQERGLCFVALKDAPRSIEALLQAVNINPALPMSWRMLEGVYRIAGDAENAAKAAAHVATLKAMPPEVVTATSLFSDGDLVPAEQIIRAFLLRHGDHPEAMRLLAKIGMAHDVLDDAELLLEATLALEPDHHAARYDYAQTLINRHKHAQAREQVQQLLAIDPGNLDYRSLAATAAVGLGEQEVAIEIYRGMLADVPGSADIQLWLGHALKTTGQVPSAIEAYRGAAAARPGFGDAYWSLANLKTYRFEDAEIACMQAEEASASISTEDRTHLCFALGKAFEDRGEIERSWSFYERGNRLRRNESHYRPEILETNTRRQIEVCNSAFFERRTGWGDPRPDPIFILGLPRAGSTLLEQILASHSQVEGTQELPDIQRFALDLQGRDPDLDDPRYPGALEDLSADDIRQMGEKYLADTQVYRSGRPFFIDKMPNNFRHIGLIHLILPKAKIIDARREPMACCFSNLKQLFAQGQEFSYSPEDIARYYRTYLDLMEHWDRALPGRVLRVHHEDIIDDLESGVRRILDYCGLDFEPGCIEFHKTRRSVRTPSSEQVRQPIFRDGLDQWRAYEPWLGPLKDALGDAVIRYRSKRA